MVSDMRSSSLYLAVRSVRDSEPVLIWPAFKPTATKARVLNAHARMGRHHHKYVRSYHHRHHKVGMIKTHAKVGFKHGSRISTRHG